MEAEAPVAQKKETAQQVFKRLRENSKIEMLEKMQKIEEAHERIVAIKAERRRREGRDSEDKPRKSSRVIDGKPSAPSAQRKVHVTEAKDNHSPTSPISATVPYPNPPRATRSDRPNCTHRPIAESTELHHCVPKRRCTNCCGGLPGQGPGSGLFARKGDCCCASGQHRLRGGSDENRSSDENLRSNRQVTDSSEVEETSGRSDDHCCGRSSSKMSVVTEDATTRSGCGSQSNSCAMHEGRIAGGGCGACGGSPQSNSDRINRSPGDRYQWHFVKLINAHSCSPAPQPCWRPCPPPMLCQKQTEFRCQETSRPSTKGGCPCGACGGAACSDNPGGGGSEGGCCGRKRPRGLPCKCKCQSCDPFRPLGGCGGQSCGRIYSCASSGGGRCCFPRNTKRRSGPDCCGGADPNCGGCC